MTAARIIVFARSPVVGKVKSRLARRLGRRAACFWYRRLLEVTLANAAATGLPVEVWLTPHQNHPWLRGLCRDHGHRQRVQRPGDLGRRMLVALREPGRVVLIGADCPALCPGQIREAAECSLAPEDLAVVPAEDGGYVLIAAEQPPAVAFFTIPWGTAAVLRRTRRQMARGPGHLHELAPCWDVDTAADLRRLLRQDGIQPWRRARRRP